MRRVYLGNQTVFFSNKNGQDREAMTDWGDFTKCLMECVSDDTVPLFVSMEGAYENIFDIIYRRDNRRFYLFVYNPTDVLKRYIDLMWGMRETFGVAIFDEDHSVLPDFMFYGIKTYKLDNLEQCIEILKSLELWEEDIIDNHLSPGNIQRMLTVIGGQDAEQA